MSFTNYLEAAVLDLVLGNVSFTPASPIYVGLSTTAINDDGSGITEPSGGYARVAMPNNSAGWNAASGGNKTNGTAIIFPTASASWGQVTYFFIADGSGGGANVWVKGSVNPSQTINQNDSVRFAVSDLSISLD